MRRTTPQRRVVIIGGGVMGCTLAYALSKRGLEVSLIEAGEIGKSGASAVPLALLNPHRGRTARAHPFDLRALELTWQLMAELEGLGYDTGSSQSGVWRIPSTLKQAQRWHKLSAMRAVDATPDTLHAPFGGFFVPTGGRVYPHKLLLALKRAALARGARFAEHTRAVALTPQAGGVRVVTRSGVRETEMLVDDVFLCTGSALGLGQEAAGFAAVAGEVITLAHALPLEQPLAGAVYGAQTAAGFCVGGNHRDAAQTDEDAPERLRESMSWFIPHLKDAPIKRVWQGVRAKAADSMPLVMTLEPHVHFVGALAGRGFLCAAHLAQELSAAFAPDT